jgi:hypothetical protein
MSPRNRKVGGLDDPIWTGPGPTEGSSDPQGAPPDHQSGDRPPAWDPGRPNTTRGERDRKTGGAPATRNRRSAPGPQRTRDQETGRGSGTTSSSQGNSRRSVGAIDIPRRILTDDPGTAGNDERECEVEGWFQTDDGVPVSSAFRPLSVACARPLGHPGHHRSAPRQARFRRGRVWVYEWGAPEPPDFR